MKAKVIVLLLVLIACCVNGKTINSKKLVQKVKNGHFETGEEGQADFDKEVFFSDEEGDDVLDLPEEEQKERLKNLVEKKMDTDHDGYLTREEIISWAEKSFDTFETEESRYEFPDLDENNDELLTWEEIAADRFGEYNEHSDDYKNPQAGEWEDYKRTYDKDKEMFAAADVDNTGSLDEDEYLIFKHPRLHEATRKLAVKDALLKSDKNQDGQIDIDEYLGEFKLTKDEEEPDWVEADREKFRYELDQNKDGVLTDDEIVEWVAPSNHEAATDEADHLISECDMDRDGRLTSKEIVDNHELWIESDATDYGAQLLKNHDEL